jgi:RNA polymerase sigma-70 factor, ECF subfamily
MALHPDSGLESTIREACGAGDFETATTVALQMYGAEVFGLLIALHDEQDAADDAFSLFAERLWKALPDFEWRCSARTWLYHLARTASADVHRKGQRLGRREVLQSTASYEEVQAAVRTETLSMLRTAKRTELERLRDELPPEDRMLLILRVDRSLPWRDVAVVLSDLTAATEETLAQEAARLRKRFQLVKERLRDTARERHLI